MYFKQWHLEHNTNTHLNISELWKYSSGCLNQIRFVWSLCHRAIFDNTVCRRRKIKTYNSQCHQINVSLQWSETHSAFKYHSWCIVCVSAARQCGRVCRGLMLASYKNVFSCLAQLWQWEVLLEILQHIRHVNWPLPAFLRRFFSYEAEFQEALRDK